MAGRHPQGMRARDESAHPVVQHAIDQGYVGTGRPYVIKGFTSKEAAERGRRSVNNAARHMGVSCSSRQNQDVHEAADGTFEVHFRLFTKASARQHITQATGGDPTKLAYNPFRRAAGPVMDDQGRRVAPLPTLL